MMATNTLTFRNLTSTPLEVKGIEHLKTSLNAKIHEKVHIGTKHGSSKLAAESHNSENSTILKRDVSIPLAPFTTLKTDLNPGSGIVFRLLLSASDALHHLECHSGRYKCQDLVSITSSSPFIYTAIYFPETAHVTLFSSTKPASWMSALKNETPVSGLSIPGTHNAPAHHHALLISLMTHLRMRFPSCTASSLSL